MLSRGRAETNAARPKDAQCNRDPPHPATRNAADSQFPGRKRVPNWYGPTGRAKQLQAQVGGIPQGVVSAETCGHPRGVHVSAGRFEALTLPGKLTCNRAGTIRYADRTCGKRAHNFGCETPGATVQSNRVQSSPAQHGPAQRGRAGNGDTALAPGWLPGLSRN